MSRDCSITPSLSLSCTPTDVPKGRSTVCTATLTPAVSGTISFAVATDEAYSAFTTVAQTATTLIPNAAGTSSSAQVDMDLYELDLDPGGYSVTASYPGDSAGHQPAYDTKGIVIRETRNVYSYSLAPYGPNGEISGYSDSVNGQWTNISYDNLERLTGAHQSSNAGVAAQNFCWDYDAYGNRLTQAISSTSFSVSGGNNCSTSGTLFGNTVSTYTAGTNRMAQTNAGGTITQVGLPDAGEVRQDSANQYLYDGEGRLCAVAGAAPVSGGPSTMIGYLYDAEGNRTGKGTITMWSCDPATNGFSPSTAYVLSFSGGQQSEVSLVSSPAGVSATWAHTNVGDAGNLFATYDSNGLHFHLSDWLNTRRMQVTGMGIEEERYQSMPYGEMSTQNLGATEHHFTGKERDTESGLDYFGARYYGSSMGRFMSPDSSGYSGLTNPQSWNLYAYTLNNPLRYDDPSGHTVECKTDAAGCLSAAQAAVGKDAAGQLTTKTTTTQNWFQKIIGTSTSTTTLQITGSESDFRAASGNASKLADFIDSKTSFGVSISENAQMEHPGTINGMINDSGFNLYGGAQTFTLSQGLIPQVFLDPRSAMVPGARMDEDRDHIPPANMGEKFAHELLGHEWGEVFGGHPAGTAANKRDAANSENEVRRTDPSRGQKTEHH